MTEEIKNLVNTFQHQHSVRYLAEFDASPYINFQGFDDMTRSDFMYERKVLGFLKAMQEVDK